MILYKFKSGEQSMSGYLKFLLYILPALSILSACSGSADQADSETAEPKKTVEKAATERAIPVEALVVRSRIVNQSVPVTGVLEPYRSVELIAELSGDITAVNAGLGTYIRTEDTLAYIDDDVAYSNYRQAKAQVLSSENNLKIAQLNLESDKQLYENGDISKLAFENARLSVKSAEAGHLSALANLSLMEENYLNTRIVSPIDGYISRKNIELGTMVSPGHMLFRVVDLSRLKINIGVAQSMIDRIRIGSKAVINISSLGNRTFEGMVKHLSPQADENTGAFTTEIHIMNTDDIKIKAGMTARVEILLSDENRQISVPDYTLVTRNGSDHVYKIEKGYAILTSIDIAESIGSTVILESGIAEGDTVVSVGMKNLGVKTRVWIEQLH